MVHNVDFRGYLKEQGVEIIEDAWGTERKVSELRMIIPLSMFKAYGWFGNNDQTVNRYFVAFQEFGHDLFITQRFLPRRSTEPYRLNYEVLQTCGLMETDFENLLAHNLNMYRNLRTDEETRIRYFTDGSHDEEEAAETEETMDEDSQSADALDSSESPDPSEKTPEDDAPSAAAAQDYFDINNNVLSQAIRLRTELVHCIKAKEILKKACDSMALNILWGQLALGEGSQGESRYLSCDLGRYLDYLASLGGKKDCKTFAPLSPGGFYAPGFSSKGTYCALIRMPHYSRNEHMVLRPHSDSDRLRNKYFGHLNGVVMLPAEGFGPQRLGGADFDGDHVAIIDDEAFVRGLGCALGLSDLAEEERDKRGGSALPFIDIPSDSTGTSCYTWKATRNGQDNRGKFAEMEFRSFFAGCRNRIGRFSNYAFSHGAAAYGEEQKADSERMVQRFTALTGLEIDSVKTGKRPKIPSELEIKNSLFLTIKGKSKKAKKEGKGLSWESGSSLNSFSLGEEIQKAQEKAGNQQNHDCRTKPCQMDQIPVRLLETHRETQHNRFSTTKLSSVFRIEDIVLNQDLVEKLGLLSDAYADRSSSSFFERRKRNAQKKKLIIDNDLSRVLGWRFDDETDYNDMCLRFANFFYETTDEQQRQIIRKKLIEQQFELSDTEARESILKEALKCGGITEEKVDDWNNVLNQFVNFRREGFTLPYIMLRMTDEREKRKKKKPEPEQKPEQEQKPKENPYRQVFAGLSGKKLQRKARAEARGLCRRYFPEANDDKITRILAAHLLNNKPESFFWDMLGDGALVLLGKDEERHD